MCRNGYGAADSGTAELERTTPGRSIPSATSAARDRYLPREIFFLFFVFRLGIAARSVSLLALGGCWGPGFSFGAMVLLLSRDRGVQASDASGRSHSPSNDGTETGPVTQQFRKSKRKSRSLDGFAWLPRAREV